jgi:hypothetical protein
MACGIKGLALFLTLLMIKFCNITTRGSASLSINKIKREITEGHWQKELKWIEKNLML